MSSSQHVYEVRPRKDHRGVDLISDALPFGRLWYAGQNAATNAVDYAKFYSRSKNVVIRVYDDAGNVIQTHEHKGDVQRPASASKNRWRPTLPGRVLGIPALRRVDPRGVYRHSLVETDS